MSYSFNQIYGNEQIKKSLKLSAAYSRVAHLYIFSGSSGCGKSLIASTFAKFLQCTNAYKGDEPCGECKSCRSFDSNNHPDVLYPVPSKTKALGVDDIREQVNTPAQVKPYNHPYKIFILEDADKMTPAAQNALLKTIEEPAAYSVFLFTAKNLDRLLPTILSRGVIYKIKPMSKETVSSYLLSQGVLKAEADRLAAYSKGSIGAALKLKEDEEFIQIRDLAARMALIGRTGYGGVSNMTKELESFKERISELLSVLYSLYRDAMVYKSCPEESFIIDTWKAPYEIAGLNSMKQLYKKSMAVYTAGVRISQNANFSMTMDVLLLNLKA